MDLNGKNILVVGASGVLGAEISRLLAAAGARVLGTASSQDSAQRIPEQVAVRLLVDLADPASIGVLTNYLKSAEPIDGVVLAAGRVGFGLALDANPAQVEGLTQINFLGPAQLITELQPHLKNGAEPFVAAITGVVAEKSFPGMAAYCAGKKAISGWLDSVAAEWRKDGIRILEARPGHTETGLATRPMFGAAPAFPTGMTATHVAQKIVEGIASDAKLLASTDF